MCGSFHPHSFQYPSKLTQKLKTRSKDKNCIGCLSKLQFCFQFNTEKLLSKKGNCFLSVSFFSAFKKLVSGEKLSICQLKKKVNQTVFSGQGWT